jgi:hypothetical protein
MIRCLFFNDETKECIFNANFVCSDRCPSRISEFNTHAKALLFLRIKQEGE